MALASVTILAASAVAAQQDWDTLKVPDGLAFSEFKGYDKWEDVAVSETEGGVKAILGNPTMIRAYKEGIPDNGEPFPEGVKVVKIEWTIEEEYSVALFCGGAGHPKVAVVH